MKVSRSKTGLPTITESGGGMSNTGYARIVCGENGQRIKPLFAPRGYSNGDHAIFVVHPGKTHLITTSRDRGGERATVLLVVGIKDDDLLELQTVAEYENGDGNIPKTFQSAVRAAMEKAKCYHCRGPHYHYSL